MTFLTGIDIGGTSVKIGFMTEEGNMIHKWDVPTNKQNGAETIIPNVWASIQDNMRTQGLAEADMTGIGVGAPGFIDVENGIVYEAVNIGWKNYHLTQELQELSGLPVYLANDANVAALGENWKGAGNNARDVIAITLGTGVGGGVISNGIIVEGANGTAGEIGHMTIDPNGYLCNCGRKGCLETIASATGIVRQAMAYKTQQPTSAFHHLFEEKGSIEAKDVFELAAQGDEPAQDILNYTMDTLGFALANAAILINPEKILIGGGVSKAGQVLIDGVHQSFMDYALPHVHEACQIKLAQLGNDAGMIGAAFLVRQKRYHVTFQDSVQ